MAGYLPEGSKERAALAAVLDAAAAAGGGGGAGEIIIELSDYDWTLNGKS